MSEAPHGYVPPHVVSANTIPPDIASYLDGSDLPEKSQAVRVSTVDVEGWPHASLLSAGDMLATAPGHIRFLLFPHIGYDRQLGTRRTGHVELPSTAACGNCGYARRECLTPIRTCRLRSSRRSSNRCDDTLPPTPRSPPESPSRCTNRNRFWPAGIARSPPCRQHPDRR